MVLLWESPVSWLIPEAHTKYGAEEAEIKLSATCLTGSMAAIGTMPLVTSVGDSDVTNDQFREAAFLDWARNNKRSWKHECTPQKR